MKGKCKMKKLFKISALLLAVLMLVFCFTACGNKVDKEGLWEDATYLKDTTVGKGDTSFKVEIAIGEQSITLTVKTDAETVGAALLENGIVEGEDGSYGLYIKKVNGVTADYDKDKAYWAFYIDGEFATSGVDSIEIDTDVTYKLEYAK